MREYENNSTNNSNNSKNNVALSITTLIINFHTSFSLERSRVIEKYFVSVTFTSLKSCQWIFGTACVLWNLTVSALIWINSEERRRRKTIIFII